MLLKKLAIVFLMLCTVFNAVHAAQMTYAFAQTDPQPVNKPHHAHQQEHTQQQAHKPCHTMVETPTADQPHHSLMPPGHLDERPHTNNAVSDAHSHCCSDDCSSCSLASVCSSLPPHALAEKTKAVVLRLGAQSPIAISRTIYHPPSKYSFTG